MSEAEAAPVSNATFARDLGISVLALLASGVLLIAVLLAYTSFQLPPGSEFIHAKHIVGSQLRPVIGSAEKDQQGIKITGLQTYGDTQNTIVSAHTTFRAENYHFLHYRLAGLQPGIQLHLIWRTADRPRSLNTTVLNRNIGSAATFDLTVNPDWRGTVTEIGIHVSGDLRGTPLRIPELVLQPYGWRAQLASLWSNWTSFRGWSQRSINFLYGTSDPRMLSPTVVAALWSGLALALVLVLALIWKQHHLVRYGAALLIPWMAVDLLWQAELSTQLDDTRHLFRGKTMQQRHLASTDSAIYRYAQRLKHGVLPDADSRIFLLHDSTGHNFQRLKTQYYLLPANIYNYGRFPPTETVRPGDFILVLGSIPGLTFDSHRHLLTWPRGQTITVEQVDNDPLGQLYRVLPQNAPGPKVPDQAVRGGA